MRHAASGWAELTLKKTTLSQKWSGQAFKSLIILCSFTSVPWALLRRGHVEEKDSTGLASPLAGEGSVEQWEE